MVKVKSNLICTTLPWVQKSYHRQILLLVSYVTFLWKKRTMHKFLQNSFGLNLKAHFKNYSLFTNYMQMLSGNIFAIRCRIWVGFSKRIEMTRGHGRWPRDFRELGWFLCARHSEQSVISKLTVDHDMDT